jgi:hypothetical protein
MWLDPALKKKRYEPCEQIGESTAAHPGRIALRRLAEIVEILRRLSGCADLLCHH